MKRVLITAFKGTSAELLVQENNYKTLLLPNNKKKDAEKLITLLQKESYDYIISFGQRPNIKNKIHIETTAKNDNNRINANIDVNYLCELFIKNGIFAKISNNAGTSYCNSIYWNGLTYIADIKLDTKMIFIHIPYIKNIDDINLFRKQIFKVIKLLTLI
ncbi:MAG: hypothetical protein J1F32_01280 [Erysipelotrichales bacterium]|nr:hypothetical protein [Erysipelotrichales bacterium]